ncbi:MAG: NAD(P)/FAD-dependent oxidoreductase [Verrucomicrobiota bacterium]
MDVVILGGAFSGAAMGMLLKRAQPGARILIVERSTEFDRKVGESTSEVAGCFLTRVLGLSHYLSRHHIAKHGLRMWFNRQGNTSLNRCYELGTYYQVRLPTYQLDRSELDAHLLKEATAAGCEVERPARVTNLDLEGEGNHRIQLKRADGTFRHLKAKWVVDATGKAACIGRQRGTLEKLPEHPTNAIWARFRNTRDLDRPDLHEKHPCFGKRVPAPRTNATNHLMGHGWWCWIIPLRDGDISAGLTYDTRLFQPPAGGNLGERLHRHLLTHPVGREIFGQAEPVEKDVRTYSGLPYYNREIAGDGWVAVGDAAGFMDPLYSQGLDYCGHTVYAAHKLIARSLDGESVKEAIPDMNQRFRQSYFSWYRALYKDKYHYLGDAELMTVAFLLDISTYFLGPVRLVYDHTDQEFALYPYHGPAGRFFAGFMAFYNQRLVLIARNRMKNGTYGRKNLDHHFLLKGGFAPQPGVVKPFLKGMARWGWLELVNLFSRFPFPHRNREPAMPPLASAQEK